MSPPTVAIELLGGFRVTVDDREIAADAWLGRRSMELVQLLALSPPHRLLRDQVIDALWPHLDPDAGAANLRKAAHQARKTLGYPAAVVLKGGEVSLFPRATVTTDVLDFEAGASAALAAGDGMQCGEVANRYGGELLPGSLYEEWTQLSRRRITGRYLDLLRAAGRWEQVVDVEPTDERAYGELMRAALARGSRPAVIRWYGRARTALATGLGVAPGADLDALYASAVADLSNNDDQLLGR